ncbi:class D beta-lactamase [Acinetobacter qingfengensis]|uniref:Class D beta-lactamase n=1 Tax=Acinetobacter qingfengensis TaxID=1262585 RepID=A0A1E7QZ01_9GAMM|nr:class D beta-lactamase [Acinetobacter qingfengensis]KAA8733152.1 class D beta-lactamase [Acinetobacter qingfengensis]OEY92302.1 class D beta-lactamase [Acinetobacter qingfengensis]
MKYMMILGILGSLVFSGCQSSLSSQQSVVTQQQTQTILADFQQAKVQGVVTIYDGHHYQNYGSDLERAKQYFIPASTFKMLNALIALQHGKVTSTETFKWDGKKQPFPAWEKDMTLAQAMQASAVPVYQQLARRIGLELMQSEIKRVGYGNQNIGSTVDNFWLVGPLKITPEQEAKFAYQLANEQLAFSKTVQQQVKNMVLIEEKQGYKLYAKSGWGMDVTPMVGWFTGWVQQPDGQIKAFSLNILMQKDTAPAIRQQLLVRTLQNLQLYP